MSRAATHVEPMRWTAEQLAVCAGYRAPTADEQAREANLERLVRWLSGIQRKARIVEAAGAIGCPIPYTKALVKLAGPERIRHWRGNWRAPETIEAVQ